MNKETSWSLLPSYLRERRRRSIFVHSYSNNYSGSLYLLITCIILAEANFAIMLISTVRRKPTSILSGALTTRSARFFIGLWLTLNLVGISVPYLYVMAGNPIFLANRVGVQSYLDEALTYLILGNTFFLLGFLVPVARRRSTGRAMATNISSKPLVLVWSTFLVIVIGVLVLGGEGASMNIVALLRKTRGAVEGQNILYLFLSGLTFQSILMSIVTIRHNKAKGPAVVLAIVTIALDFICGSRIRAALTLLVPATYQAVYGGIRARYIVLGAAVAVLILVGGATLRSSLQSVESAGSVDEGLFSSLSILDPMALSLAMSDRMSPNSADSVATLILWVLPKSLVGEKDPVAPILARYMYFGDSTGGITLGLYGELAYYFGAFGLVILCVGLGIAAQALVQKSNGASLVSFVSFLALYFMLFSSVRNGIFVDLLNYPTFGLLLALNLVTQRAFMTHTR
jgi:oligosaccharide repeat unit polymerase